MEGFWLGDKFRIRAELNTCAHQLLALHPSLLVFRM
jgi:hypothetical protein